MFTASTILAGRRRYLIVEALPTGGWDWATWAAGSAQCASGASGTASAAMAAAEQAAVLLQPGQDFFGLSHAPALHAAG